MNRSLIIFAMWLPYIFLFAIYGTIYCIRGYKKGLYRSLVSVGAAVVSGIISAILAKSFAAGIANNTYNAVMSDVIGDANPIYAEIVELFAKGFLQGVIALFMFSLILFLLTIVLKIIASVIVKDKFEPENKGMRWGGLSVRFVEAMVFSLLLLLPIYGTLATYLPIAKDAMLVVSPTTDEDIEPIVEIVDNVSEHPLIDVVKTKPIEAIYNGLAAAKIDNANMNIPKMVSSVSGVLERFNAIEGLPEGERKEAVQSLIKYIDDNFVGQEWFYDIYLIAKNEFVKEYNSSTGDLSGEEKVFADELIKSLDISEKDFQTCIDGSIDFVEYLIETDFYEKMEGEDLSVLESDDFLSHVGEWLNCSEAMVSIKKMMILSMLTETTESAEDAIEVLSNMDIKIHTDKEEQKKEVAEIIALLKGEEIGVD